MECETFDDYEGQSDPNYQRLLRATINQKDISDLLYTLYDLWQEGTVYGEANAWDD